MKKNIAFLSLILALAVSVSAPLPAAAQAPTNDVTRFSTGADPDAPSCPDTQVLTYQNNQWVCTNNFTNAGCPNGQAVQYIRPDGTPACGNYSPPPIAACPPGEAVQSIAPNGARNCVRITTYPDCATPDVLNSHDGANYICEPGTSNFELPLGTLTAFYGTCTGNAFGQVSTGPGLTGGCIDPVNCNTITIFAADCSMACDNWCKLYTRGGINIFNSGLITEYYQPTQSVGCTCLK